MPCSVVLLYKENGIVQESDFDSIVNRSQEEQDGKCDFQTLDWQEGEAFDGLKFVNLWKIIAFLVRYITAQFEPSCMEHFSLLQTEQFILSASAIPL
jgi:hypothetical protein